MLAIVIDRLHLLAPLFRISQGIGVCGAVRVWALKIQLPDIGWGFDPSTRPARREPV